MKNKFKLLICFLLIFSMVGSVGASEFYARKTLWALEFEDSMGGAENYTFAEFSLELKNGTLAGRYIESKPYMELNAFDSPIAADEVECIDVKISSKNDMMLKFYFATDKEPGWSEERAFYILPTGGSEMNTYSIKTSSIKNWGNNVTRFRMDFKGTDGDYATNELNLDYIRVLGAEGNSAEIRDEGIVYDFEKNSQTDGWKFNSENDEAVIKDGVIYFESDGAKTLETCGQTAVSAKEIGNVSISMKNETSADKARLYFTNTAGGTYENYFEFDIIPNDDKIRTYTILTGKDENWTGEMNGFKFDFGGESGKITVDEIILHKYPYETTVKNGVITVKGKAEPQSAVSLQISKYGEDLEDYAEAVIYTDEAKAAADGSFVFTCIAPSADEPIKLSVTAAVDNALYVSRASYIPAGYADVILEIYNEAVEKADSAKVSEIVSENYEYLEINASGYEEYMSAYENAETFGKILVEAGTADSVKTLEKNISNAAIFVMFTESTKNTAVLIAEKYDETIKLSQERAYDIYCGLSLDEKAEIAEEIRANANSLDDIRGDFTEKTVLYGISFTIGTDAVKKIVHDNKDLIGISVSGENSLKNPERLYAELAGNLYNSYAELEDAYNKALKKCKDDEKSSSVSSSSSSSGGGGGSSGKATVPVMPTVTVEKSEIFSDLKDFGWAKESIEKLYEKGIISGREKDKYMPSENVSRAEFVKMLTIALGITERTEIPFKDVAETAWYREYIEKAFAAGIIVGNADGTFCPDEPISRQDMAVIIYRAAKNHFMSTVSSNFIDAADIAEYASEAVAALNTAGIVNGMPNGGFMPQGFATRAQTAVIIERLMKHIGKI